MSIGSKAFIGRGETIEHILADRKRLQVALEDQTLPAEKREEIQTRFTQVEAQLAEIKSAIDSPDKPAEQV